ncbi:MAG: GspH/FimT family pseudopilin [Proteobacteria bacterium]|nr:GspH/FimT family pseudopilin [Pseudomonadota bacterium]MBU1688718.1 GspH/FimT family pseudopilin [Pseudomonadota bacterium]
MFFRLLPRRERPGDVYSQQGFSLLEMIAVLVIVAMMFSVAVPSLSRMIDGLRFRQEFRRFAATLRYARLVSVSRREVVRFTIDDLDGCKMVLTGALEEERDCQLVGGDVLTLDPDEVVFFPEGHATPGILTLTRDEKFKRIRIDLLTGLPLVEKDFGVAR